MEDRAPRVRLVDACDGCGKVIGFAEYVKAHLPHVEWLWIDTCCIKQDSDRELSEAINSMFKWYREAEVYLAYLVDVEEKDDLDNFKASKWFRRGWTLQELLAPRTVVFLTKDWRVIGHKGGAGRGKSGVTGIVQSENRASRSCTSRYQREHVGDDDLSLNQARIGELRMILAEEKILEVCKSL